MTAGLTAVNRPAVESARRANHFTTDEEVNMSNPENKERPNSSEKSPPKTVNPATASKIGKIALGGSKKG